MTENIPAELARAWWRALMVNVTALLEDADALLSRRSAGRAMSLHVLAMEELAKALWIYEVAEDPWTQNAAEVPLPDDFDARAVQHFPKLVDALRLDIELEGFWGDPDPIVPSSIDSPDDLVRLMTDFYEDLTSSARGLNRAKQAGFYVDRTGTEISSPQDAATAEEVAGHIERTAQVALMHLITDHSRMKLLMPAEAYDSTHDLQWRLMEFGYAEDMAAWREQAQAGEEPRS